MTHAESAALDAVGWRDAAFLDVVVARRGRHALFFDIDGTLLEIAPTPDSVVVPPSLPDALRDASRRLGGALALVSGRSLAWIDTHFRQALVCVSGLHGIERRSFDGTVVRLAAPPALAAARREIAQAGRAWPGILVEDKGLTIAVHYRAAPAQASAVQRLLQALAAGSGGTLEALPGKALVELRPTGTDKGAAVSAFLREPPFLGRVPVFFGDDRTDEDAFAAVRAHGGVAVAVGRPAHDVGAHFALPDPAAVRAFVARAAAPAPAGSPA